MSMSKTVRLGAVLGATALLAAGCLSDSGSSGSSSSGGGAPIEIVGAFSGTQQEGFVKDIAAVSAATGIPITYTSLSDFDTVIRSRVAGNNAPDIAIFPQPGLMLDLAKDGSVVPLADAGVDVAADSASMVPGLVDTVTGTDGTVYGLPYSMNVKSLVWYPKAAWDAAGYAAPTTNAELMALTEKISAAGTTPWCIGIESGAATGWPATDWLEEYVLREGGPDVYDQWVKHEIPFNDPIVKKAAEDFAAIALANNSGYVYGGQQGLVSTNFGDAANPLFTTPPGCYLHRQGNFITSFWPETVTADIATNAGIFLLPPVEGGYDGQPVLGGGDFMGLFDTTNADAATVLEAIAAPDFGANSAATGAWLSPNTTFDSTLYPNAILKAQADLVATADVFRFDGSDQMPGQVGTGTFWKGMVEWLSGQKDIDTVLAEIDASWPTS
jgi:alpha-glucoside transport system substrate-binding protein